tara:strand:+ start:411 stop:848 length:438 start_codon:yes stop_codon:yes gene_type:complete
MRFTVGDLIYLLSGDKKHLFPAQIVEEIRRKTLDEEAVSYNIQLPDAKQTVVSLGEVKGDVFTDLSTARESMIQHAVSLIDKIVDQAALLSESFETVSKPPPEEVSEIPVTPDSEEGILSDTNGIVEVDLGNGIMGKVNISEIGA